MNDRQLSALTDPLNDADQMATIRRHRFITQAGDGALITTVLAVDR